MIDTRKSKGNETSAESADLKRENEGQRIAVYEDLTPFDFGECDVPDR